MFIKYLLGSKLSLLSGEGALRSVELDPSPQRAHTLVSSVIIVKVDVFPE